MLKCLQQLTSPVKAATTRRQLILSIVLFPLITLILEILAQGQTSALAGFVTDPNGNVVIGAIITATHTATGMNRTAITSKEGVYNIPQLAPGIYSIRCEREGFSAAIQRGIEISVNSPATVNIVFRHIEVFSDVMDVSGNESSINKVNATLGNTFNETMIRQLPLEGRNAVGLLAAQPGVVFISKTDYQGIASDYRSGSVNGGRSDQANITLDGIDVNDQQQSLAFHSVLRVTLDSVQEFRVTTANPPADQGRSSGGQVSLITKSGSNHLHGTAYEYHRNTATTANDWFSNAAGVSRGKLLRNVFGGTLGGPIVKDRFFGFLSYEGRRDRREDTDVRSVPSEHMRRGILKYNNTDGSVTILLPEQIKIADPAGIGVSQASLALLQKYPLPNDFSSGVGDGINIFGHRFKAPVKLDFNTYITRLDYILTDNTHHVLFWRGNLQNDSDDGLPQFSGQAPLYVSLNNSKGHAIGYTGQIRESLLNNFRYGYTRQGLERIGASMQPNVTFRSIDPLMGITRSYGRIVPVHNIIDDVTWVRGLHAFGFGANIRFIRSSRYSLDNSFPTASVFASWLQGAGKDLRPTDISSGVTAFGEAMMAVLGIVSRGTARYNFDRTGKLLGIGEPIKRRFGADEYEWYGQDAWHIRKDLTLTLGLRYSVHSPPFETNGNQVSPNIHLSDWFNLRGANAQKGIPSNAAPSIYYDLSGPANGKRGFYDWDKNNFAPRISFAYAPNFDNVRLKRIFGDGGKLSLRGGIGLSYDRVGSALAVNFDQDGSFGLSTSLDNPAGVISSRNAPRFIDFNTIPAGLLPPAPNGGFPSKFPGLGERGSFALISSVDDTLRTPYLISLTFSVQREFRKNFVVEAAYVGRLGRKLLTKADLAMPVDLFDPASGDSYFSATNKLIDMFQQGIPLTGVPKLSYWENLYPSISANQSQILSVMNGIYGYNFSQGTALSATQVMYLLYNEQYPRDYTSALFDIDTHFGCGSLEEGKLPCSKFGPYAFWNDQFSSLWVWRSIGYSDYQGLQLTLRKRSAQGLHLDFNYSLSKSVDWSSVPERQNSFSGLITNSWVPGQNKAVSDFDVRHMINLNYIYPLSISRNKYVRCNLRTLCDAFFGGWQLTGILRWTSGLPVSVQNGAFWPTNWADSGYATRTGIIPKQQTTKNAPAATADGTPGPNIFPDPAAALTSYTNTRPGQTGERNGIRGDGYITFDAGLGKMWKLPVEGHTLQFRWEVFNLANTVRFDPRSATLDLGSGKANFGKYSSTLTQSRVMQFALRLEF